MFYLANYGLSSRNVTRYFWFTQKTLISAPEPSTDCGATKLQESVVLSIFRRLELGSLEPFSPCSYNPITIKRFYYFFVKILCCFFNQIIQRPFRRKISQCRCAFRYFPSYSITKRYHSLSM